MTTDVPSRAAGAAPTRRVRSGLRWTSVGILLTLMGIAVLGAVVARFCRSELLDTDRYVATMAPLGSDPAIHNELADRITTAVSTRVDIEQVTADALTALADNLPQAAERPRVADALRALPPLVAAQAEAAIHQVALSLVSSEEFQRLWVAANRRAHETLVALLVGGPGTAVEVDDQGTVSISLQAVLEIVRQRLAERGITLGDRLPEVDAQFVLFRSADLVKARQAVRTLDRLANALPWIALAAAGCAVWSAPRAHRTRALALAGSSAALAMVVLAVALVIGRRAYLDAMPPQILSADAAAALIDAVYAPLRAGLRAVLAVGVIVAMASYLAGPSISAQAVRRGGARALAALRGRRHGDPTAAEILADRYRMPLRAVIVAGAALAVAFWPFPTGLVVLGIASVTGVLLLAVELVARAAPKSETAQRQGESS
ncbi:hypothetical protein [Nocardia sp. NPDC057030]|uniref:hypothetical protein n=1 Tax=unclassified Nocardia TaxID=2637762 RepID=UPI00362C25C0